MSECIAKVKFLEVKQTLTKPAYSMEGNRNPGLSASPAPAGLRPQKGKHASQALPVCTDPGAMRPREMSNPVTGWQQRAEAVTPDVWLCGGQQGKRGGRARVPGWSSVVTSSDLRRGEMLRPPEAARSK